MDRRREQTRRKREEENIGTRGGAHVQMNERVILNNEKNESTERTITELEGLACERKRERESEFQYKPSNEKSWN